MDERLQKLSNTIVNYSVRVKENDLPHYLEQELYGNNLGKDLLYDWLEMASNKIGEAVFTGEVTRFLLDLGINPLKLDSSFVAILYISPSGAMTRPIIYPTSTPSDIAE